MFDIDAVTEQTSADVEVLHPVTRVPTGAVITLAGPEHPDRKKIQFDRQRKLRAKFAKKGRFDIVDPADEEDDEIEFLVGSTLGWKGFGKEGKPLEFSPAAARDLYGRPEMRWLRQQMLAALNDLENFIKSSVTA